MLVDYEYYPPITYKDMEYLFDIPISKLVKMSKYNEIKTKKIGSKTYVSINSIKGIISNLQTDIKSIQRNIIKRKLMKLKEDKILKLSKLIRQMRNINSVFQSYNKGGICGKRFSKNFTSSEDINLILNEMDNYSHIDDLSIDLRYSEIKGVVLEVREMKHIFFTDTMTQRLKELKLKG
jgi:hypothetical protein